MRIYINGKFSSFQVDDMSSNLIIRNFIKKYYFNNIVIMIQVGTELKIVDNSGAKKAYCIKVLSTSSNNKIAKVGSFILVVIKALRKQKSKSKSKVKKGEIVKALVIRTKNFNKNNIYFFENAVVLYSKQMKLIGTRIFGPILKSFRYTKHLRITLISKKLV